MSDTSFDYEESSDSCDDVQLDDDGLMDDHDIVNVVMQPEFIKRGSPLFMRRRPLPGSECRVPRELTNHFFNLHQTPFGPMFKYPGQMEDRLIRDIGTFRRLVDRLPVDEKERQFIRVGEGTLSYGVCELLNAAQDQLNGQVLRNGQMQATATSSGSCWKVDVTALTIRTHDGCGHVSLVVECKISDIVAHSPRARAQLRKCMIAAHTRHGALISKGTCQLYVLAKGSNDIELIKEWQLKDEREICFMFLSFAELCYTSDAFLGDPELEKLRQDLLTLGRSSELDDGPREQVAKRLDQARRIKLQEIEEKIKRARETEP